MIYSLRGMVFTMVAMAGFGAYTVANRSVNYASAKATIYMIDRSCNFTEETRDRDTGRVTEVRGFSDSCSSTDEFAKIRTTRAKKISGKATVMVNYTSPADGSSQSGSFQITGADDDFYTLKAGDQVDILVSKKDPAKIIKS